LVLRDLNAKSHLWDRGVENHKDYVLADWADKLRLSLLNWNFVLSYWRRRKESCVDVLFASANAARHIVNWRVALEIESDHRYILMEIGAFSFGLLHRTASKKYFPRQSVSRGHSRQLPCLKHELHL